MSLRDQITQMPASLIDCLLGSFIHALLWVCVSSLDRMSLPSFVDALMASVAVRCAPCGAVVNSASYNIGHQIGQPAQIINP